MTHQGIPRACRPLRAEVLAVADVLRDGDCIGMTERQFVGAVMRASGGAASPLAAADWYARLVADAGLSAAPQTGAIHDPQQPTKDR